MPIDMSMAAKAPPRKPARTRTKQHDEAVSTSIRDLRAEGLMTFAQIGQGLCLAAGLKADAGAIGKHSPAIAVETAKLADRYEWLSKPLDVLITVGPMTAWFMATMPLILQLAANHRRVDGSALSAYGVVAPELLEAQMMADMAQAAAAAMQQQTDALRNQKLAYQNALEAQREYEELQTEMMAA